METIYDLIRKIRDIENQLPEALSKASLSVATDGIALANMNIVEKGFGEIYQSEEYMDYRAELGHQTEFVDLSLSGRMWMGMIPSEDNFAKWKNIFEKG